MLRNLVIYDKEFEIARCGLSYNGFSNIRILESPVVSERTVTFNGENSSFCPHILFTCSI